MRRCDTDRNMTRAEFLGRYRDKRVYRFVVRVRYNERLTRNPLAEPEVEYHTVVSTSAGEACNFIRDKFVPLDAACVEIDARGPKGGVTSRYIGWESAIWRGMCAAKAERQADLLNADVS